MNESASIANRALYETYYDKPSWWFRLRYDTQFKCKTCRALCRTARPNWNDCTVFELGFGAGDSLLTFPRTCRVEGVELSNSAIQLARKRLVRAGFAEPRLVAWTPGPIELGEARLDCAILSHVLEHVPDESSTLSSVFRALKRGGHLIVLVPINERYKDPNHVRGYTSISCRSAAEGAGFQHVTGFENECLFYLVERMYWSHVERPWTAWSNAARWLFNLSTAWWPFWMFRTADALIMRATGLPPRQAAMLFRKP